MTYVSAYPLIPQQLCLFQYRDGGFLLFVRRVSILPEDLFGYELNVYIIDFSIVSECPCAMILFLIA